MSRSDSFTVLRRRERQTRICVQGVTYVDRDVGHSFLKKRERDTSRGPNMSAVALLPQVGGL